MKKALVLAIALVATGCSPGTPSIKSENLSSSPAPSSISTSSLPRVGASTTSLPPIAPLPFTTHDTTQNELTVFGAAQASHPGIGDFAAVAGQTGRSLDLVLSGGSCDFQAFNVLSVSMVGTTLKIVDGVTPPVTYPTSLPPGVAQATCGGVGRDIGITVVLPSSEPFTGAITVVAT